MDGGLKISSNMYSIYTVKHSEATTLDLERAITLKSVAWPYSKDSQMQWIKNNLKPEDIHVFLLEDGEYIAYLNIAMVQVKINGTPTICAGIGNVCSSRKGGGKNLMILTNDFITDLNIPGILFCRDNLVEFYNKYNWFLLRSEQVTLSHLGEGINTMVYNLNTDSTIIYADRNF